ncbi:hypothetical protein ACUXIR_000730 [Staphylococcus hominis]
MPIKRVMKPRDFNNASNSSLRSHEKVLLMKF